MNDIEIHEYRLPIIWRRAIGPRCEICGREENDPIHTDAVKPTVNPAGETRTAITRAVDELQRGRVDQALLSLSTALIWLERVPKEEA